MHPGLLEFEQDRTSSEQAATCDNCRFSTSSGYANRVYCRRYPPTVTFNDSGQPTIFSPSFPDVGKSSWCGEYQQRLRENP